MFPRNLGIIGGQCQSILKINVTHTFTKEICIKIINIWYFSSSFVWYTKKKKNLFSKIFKLKIFRLNGIFSIWWSSCTAATTRFYSSFYTCIHIVTSLLSYVKLIFRKINWKLDKSLRSVRLRNGIIWSGAELFWCACM